jgi:hypothetical protein
MLRKVQALGRLSFRILLILLLPLVFPAVTAGQEPGSSQDGADRRVPEVDTFFAEHPRSEMYASIRAELHRLFAAVRDEGVPPAPLMSVLREAAAKRVPAERLLQALAAESERLRLAVDVLAEYQLLPAQDTARGDALRRISVYLQGELSVAGMQGIARSAAELETGLAATLEAMEAVSSVTATAGLAPDRQRRLGEALLMSELDPDGYGAVRSAYVKGRLAGLTAQTITEIVVRVLEAGGGIIQIDRELTERGRR